MGKNRRVKEPTMLESLDALVAEHHLLKHPFYQAWTEGTLSRESLQVYAEQYYHHVRSFPENLRQLATRANGSLAELVNENLSQECNASGSHEQLWRQFAESLGVADADLDRARPLPGVAAQLDTFDEVACEGTLAQAVGAFYVYEAQMPELAARKVSSLRRFYDINDAHALAYFLAHEEADIRHRAVWRGWLSSQTDADSFGVLCAAERVLKALWGALDAVYPQACAAARN
jgi:pyrroloquinoline-quinone synthase